jgi:hypothetical protein
VLRAKRGEQNLAPIVYQGKTALTNVPRLHHVPHTEEQLPGQAMGNTAIDQRHDMENALASALMNKATEHSRATRDRLAVVAGELRDAATATAGSTSDNLKQLADRFEQHSKNGGGR